MVLPLAIYTAQKGYGWVSGLEHGRAALELCRKALGKFPESDFGDAMMHGAVNSGDTVVAYRFIKAEKWDFKRRDALYLVVTFFPRAVASEIDIEQLLGMGLFTKPMREPPAWLEYHGRKATSSEYDPESDAGTGVVNVDLSSAGSIFQKAFPGTLKIWREAGSESGQCKVVYRQPLPPEAVSAQMPMPIPAESSVEGKRQTWLIAAAIVALMLLSSVFGALFGPRLRIWRERNQKESCETRLPLTTKQCVCPLPMEWFFGEDWHWLGLARQQFEVVKHDRESRE